MTLLPAAFTIPDISLADLPTRLRKRTTIDPVSGCWTVGGGLTEDGYARYAKGLAHRYVWKRFVGPIPADTPQLDHVKARGCVHRNCIWLAHLEPVTSRENTLRGDTIPAANVLKDACTTCGKPYDGPNLYVYPDGRRDCRACRADARERYEERKALAMANAAGFLFDLPRAA